MSGLPWCISVEAFDHFERMMRHIEESRIRVVVATLEELGIAELASLESRKGALGLHIIAVSDQDVLPAPMGAIANQTVNRKGGFEALRTALRTADAANQPVSEVREPMAVYGAPRQLTPREREVARLISQGLPNRRIAKVLGIQEQSVKNVVSVVMRKLDCQNRVQVALHLSSPSL